MTFVQQKLRGLFLRLEALLDYFFTPQWNPFYQLGALGFFYYWVVAVSGIYIYLFFDISAEDAYNSVEYMTNEQWYLAGVMRSLHRYASDGMVLMLVIHLMREFAMGRFKGPRWFTWVTGVPVAWLVFASGITGYWLVWDKLAQYIAIETSEWLDWLGVFSEPFARNFLSPLHMDDRLFTLLTFMHIFFPLILLFILWVHLIRVYKPKVNPSRGLAVGTLLMLLALSLLKPAESQGIANLNDAITSIGLDWFYLFAYPLMDQLGDGPVWGAAIALSIILLLLPWLPPRRRARSIATVDLMNCNGCKRCAEDCPFSAIDMRPRSDGARYDLEAVVSADKCLSCGICAGTCPTSTPFRRRGGLTPGIQLADRTLQGMKDEMFEAAENISGGTRILVFGCDHGVDIDRVTEPGVGMIRIPCTGALPPSFIDYALSRNLADGVIVSGCRDGDCHYRFGQEWLDARVGRRRDPYLGKRVPRERIAFNWATPDDSDALSRAVTGLRERLSQLEDAATPPAPSRAEGPDANEDRAEVTSGE
jgi:quinol-cytochrome oxidoreductase complex cytochrome b subunit/coenzyme F420-reducing hydrogenase delta subunit